MSVPKGDRPRDLILGIETATPYGGVALADVAGNLLAQRWAYCPTGYSRRLLANIDSILRETGGTKEHLKAITVTRGPGSFTGVRVGLTTAKTLAHALSIPLYIYSTLDCLARRWPAAGDLLCVLLDARRKEIYSGVYQSRGAEEPELIRDHVVESCASLLDALERLKQLQIWFSGDGADVYRADLLSRLKNKVRIVPPPWNRPSADVVALRGAEDLKKGVAGIDPFLAVPDYLRASDAEVNLAARQK